jgi:hypothetical protein
MLKKVTEAQARAILELVTCTSRGNRLDTIDEVIDAGKEKGLIEQTYRDRIIPLLRHNSTHDERVELFDIIEMMLKELEAWEKGETNGINS